MKKTLKLFLCFLLFIPILVQAQWQQLNTSCGGNISTLIYVNGAVIAGSGAGTIYRSTDNGLTWKESYNAVGGISNMIEMNGTLYASTGGRGILLSTDGGITWKTKNDHIPSLLVGEIAQSGKDLLAIIFGQVYISKDSANTWTNINYNLNTQPYSIAVFDTTIYAATTSGLYFKSNNSQSWQLQTGTADISSYGVEVFGDTLYMGLEYNFATIDKNGNMTKKGMTPDLTTVMTFYQGHPYIGTRTGVYKYINDSQGWTEVNNGNLNSSIASLMVVGDTLFAGTVAQGLMVSSINNPGWQYRSKGLSTCKVNNIIEVSGNLLFSTPQNIYASKDNGVNWYPIRNNGIFEGSFMEIFKIHSYDNKLYSGTSEGIFYLNSQDSTWVNTNFPETVEFRLYMYSNGNDLYVLNDDMYRWRPSKGSWEKLSVGLENTYCWNITAYKDMLFTGTYTGLFKSTDDGESWVKVTVPSPVYENIDGLRVKGDTIFVTQENQIIWSEDGINWNVLASQISPRGPINYMGNQIFAGDYSEGIIVTTLPDNVFTKENAGLKDLDITDFLVTSTDVFAGTGAGGIYRYTNNTPAAVSAADLSQTVSIFPNPSPDGNIVVQVSHANELLEITLFDMTGRKISSMSSASGAFALGTLQKGLYLLEVRQGDHVYTKKLSLGE